MNECMAHSKYKEAILAANDTGTVITNRRMVPTRSLKTQFSAKLLELEGSGAGPEELSQFIGFRNARKGLLDGDLVNGEAYCGASAGLIKEILPAAEVVRRLSRGFEEVLKRLAVDETA